MFVFPAALGEVLYYGSLPATNDGLLVVPLEDPVEDDATLAAYTDLGSLLGNNPEQATMGRQALTSVTVTPSPGVGSPAVLSADSPVWTGASGSAVAALLLCYDPDTTTGTDADIIPLLKWEWPVTPGGSDVTAQFPDAGSYGIFAAQ